MCVSYILSSFYYASLETKKLEFIKPEKLNPDGTKELNCVMRLTDDYLLMSTSKNTAMKFITELI